MSDFPTIQKGIYRHNKKNQLYEVLGVALETETDIPLVIYRSIHKNKYELFARPYDMFVEVVEIDSKTVPRFEEVTENVDSVQ